MLHWLPTLFVTVSLLLFAVPTLAMAVAVIGMSLARMGMATYELAVQRDRLALTKWTGAMIGAPVWIIFAGMFGWGAYLLGANVINGFITRFIG